GAPAAGPLLRRRGRRRARRATTRRETTTPLSEAEDLLEPGQGELEAFPQRVAGLPAQQLFGFGGVGAPDGRVVDGPGLELDAGVVADHVLDRLRQLQHR